MVPPLWIWVGNGLCEMHIQAPRQVWQWSSVMLMAHGLHLKNHWNHLFSTGQTMQHIHTRNNETKTTAASSREHWVPHTVISPLHSLSQGLSLSLESDWWPASSSNPPVFTPAPALGLRPTATPGFLHGYQGFELWSSCLCDKHFCLLSHLPRTQQIQFFYIFPRQQSQ